MNTSPIFTLTPKITGQTILSTLTANANSDGTGNLTSTPTMVLLFTASASGSFVSKIRISAAGTTSVAMEATVISIYISSITSGATTNANTFLFAEISTAAITAASATVATNYYEIPVNLALQANQTILASIRAVPAANTHEWVLLTFAGDYV
jgi:hypothetical protein